MIAKLITPAPHNIFLLVWLVPLLAPYLLKDHPLIQPVSFETKALVIYNIGVFYFFAILLILIGLRGSVSKVKCAIERIDFFRLSRRVKLLAKVWVAVYALNIIGSGGIPLLWVLIGDSRTYADFGLPTLGGLGNMLRAFILSSCYLIFFHSKLSARTRRKYAALGLFLISSAFILETGRGNGVVLILHPIALHMLATRFRLSSYIKWLVLTFAFLISLGGIQALRYVEGLESLEVYAENTGFADMSGLQLFLIPSLAYIAIPIVNTDLNAIISPLVKFEPYYSVQGIIPTIIRDTIFEKRDYGELVNEAHNVSSYYIPFLRDFGLFGAALVVTLLAFIVSYCFIKARTGNVFYIFIYPPLFMSTVLSFFSLFFTSLVVILYPLLAVWVLRGCVARVRKT